MAHKTGFGIFSPQAGMSFKGMIERATNAEKLGYHSIWLVDHFWNRGVPEADVLECTTMMSAIAACTSTIRIGSLVICNSFRNPALLAKALTTIDNISNGRLEVGLGAGWMDEEYRGYGYEFPSTGTRLRQLEEGVQILKAMFSQSKASFAGRYYTVADAYNNPQPVQKPHPPILMGGQGSKALRGVIEYCDGWMPIPARIENLVAQVSDFRRQAEQAGRDPKSISITIFWGRSDKAAIEQYEKAGAERVIFLLPPAPRDTVMPKIDECAKLIGN